MSICLLQDVYLFGYNMYISLFISFSFNYMFLFYYHLISQFLIIFNYVFIYYFHFIYVFIYLSFGTHFFSIYSYTF